MATYAKLADLAALGVNARVLESFTKPEQDRAIAEASDTIDSYLRARFTLPLLSFGTDIVGCCAVLAAYSLLSARGYNPDTPGDGNFRERYLDRIRWLEMISKGQAVPNVTDSAPSAGPGVPSSRSRMVSSSSRGWSRRGSTDNNGGGPFGLD